MKMPRAAFRCSELDTDFDGCKVGYHAGTLAGVTASLPNPSMSVAPTLAAVRDAIAARFGAARAS
jgi:hypothetical protein